jgi:hypothetical protein
MVSVNAERCHFHGTETPLSDGKLEVGADSKAPQAKEVRQERGGHMSTNNQPADTEGNKKRNRRPKPQSKQAAASGSADRVRVRTKPLDQIDEDKIALAYWLLAKQIVENGNDDESNGALPAGVRK